MRPERDLYLPPGEINIGMMIGGFGQFADAICESQRIAKVFKGILLFEMMFLNHVPIGAELLLQLAKGEGRRT